MITTMLFTITVGAAELHCGIDDNQRYVEVNETHHHQLGNLIDAVPELVGGDDCLALAKAANFLLKGITYTVIEDIEGYQEQYCTRVAAEDAAFDERTRRISDYGVFDVSVMKRPSVQANTITFFVQDRQMGLPYKVTIALPQLTNHYQLLPYTG
jgi:hypothetical protein